MPVPYLGNALRGWVSDSNITIITQAIVDHEVVESQSDVIYQANFQPMPAAKVNRKPQEQRTWKWWSVIIQDDEALLTTDDIIQELSSLKSTFFGFVNYDQAEPYEGIVGLLTYDDDNPPSGNFLKYSTAASAFLIPGRKFRVEQANDWRQSGFTKYEVVEDYS